MSVVGDTGDFETITKLVEVSPVLELHRSVFPSSSSSSIFLSISYWLSSHSVSVIVPISLTHSLLLSRSLSSFPSLSYCLIFLSSPLLCFNLSIPPSFSALFLNFSISLSSPLLFHFHFDPLGLPEIRWSPIRRTCCTKQGKSRTGESVSATVQIYFQFYFLSSSAYLTTMQLFLLNKWRTKHPSHLLFPSLVVLLY